MIKTNASSWRMQVLIFFGFVLYTLATLLFCNRFSPLFSHLFEPDPCMFYMLGRAWCAGYLPYADIIDVKGPLLIAIYALIYLTSPGNPCMVYVFNSLFTAGTLFFSYKTASLFLQNTYQAILAAALVLPCICAPWYYHGGNQSEIIMMLPVSICIYYTACFFYTNREEKRKYRSLGIAAGSCFAICALIKYNNIIFPCILSSLILSSSLREGNLPLFYRAYLLSFAAAAALWIAPFAVYLFYSDTWNSFINIYFTLNFETLSSSNRDFLSHSYLLKFTVHSITRSSVILLSVIALRTSPFSSNQSKDASVHLQILVISSYLSNIAGLFPYYMLTTCPFTIFPSIVLVSRCFKARDMKVLFLLLICNMIGAIQFCGSLAQRTKTLLQHQNLKHLETELSNHPNSRIMYIDTLDIGLGLRGKSLPAIPSWCKLNGLNPTTQELEDAITQSTPDYIFIWQGATNPNRTSNHVTKDTENVKTEILRKNGYYCFSSAFCPDGSNSIISAWKKSGLQEDRSELTPAAR